MNNDLQIASDFLAPLFDEIFDVKEKDFSIQYNPLGEGKQKLLFIIEEEGVDYLPETDMLLLKSIVDKGLKKQFSDLWLLNLCSAKNADLQDLIDFFKPFQVIVWGCDSWLSRQNIKVDLHQQKMLQGVDFLKANSVHSYLNDSAMKGKLWLALQKMFFN